MQTETKWKAAYFYVMELLWYSIKNRREGNFYLYSHSPGSISKNLEDETYSWRICLCYTLASAKGS